MLPVWCRLWGLFLSTPSARRATLAVVPCGQVQQHFYPRPPRGGRPCRRPMWSGSAAFLSTPSARRATVLTCVVLVWTSISIHALREEGDGLQFVHCAAHVQISIHALREEGDSKNGESIPAFDQSINQAAQIGKSCERKTFLKLEICAERQAFPGAKVPGI